jgi:hypothetical protein
MAETHDLSNPSKKAGDSLRDMVANLLERLYQKVETERYVGGKDVDVYYEEANYGNTSCRFVEVKDVKEKLTNSQVATICADYAAAMQSHPESMLIIVTRVGITPQARDFIASRQHVRHMTIWDLEEHVLGLTEYVRHLSTLSRQDGLDQYYIMPSATEITYDDPDAPVAADHLKALFQDVTEWIDGNDRTPVAITGTYGSGKSSFAKVLVSHLATQCLSDPTKRKPILIELGDFNSHNKIEGILGAKITKDFRCPNFNYLTFEDLNRKGRLVIVLDGFDEMKHAMQIDDFFRQMRTINSLVDGKAKVVLLGRPNAFTSNDEEVFVLRGMKRQIDGRKFISIPDATKYRHLRIAPFTPSQTEEFVEKYLAAKNATASHALSDAEIAARTQEVKRLVGADPELFGKPVHLRIITDLARVPEYDLGSFSSKASRWQLYADFFDSLLERELERDGRDRIRKEDRLKFLERLAQWLWRSRDGVTSFRVEEVPDILTQDIATQAHGTQGSLLKDLLMGPIIERKADDVFFFSHRSFAEYLVASTIFRDLPGGRNHTAYSSMYSDGVEIFLRERVTGTELAEWPKSLAASNANISFDYLKFLSQCAGGLGNLIVQLGAETPFAIVLKAFGDDLTFTPESVEALYAALRHPSKERFYYATSLLNIARMYGANDNKTGTRYIAGVLDRFFNGVKLVDEGRSAWVKPHYEDARHIATNLITNINSSGIINVDFGTMIDAMETQSQFATVKFNYSSMSAMSLFIGTEPLVNMTQVAPHMKQENVEKIAIFSKRQSQLSAIFIKETV